MYLFINDTMIYLQSETESSSENNYERIRTQKVHVDLALYFYNPISNQIVIPLEMSTNKNDGMAVI